jgi:hypothetical protein
MFFCKCENFFVAFWHSVQVTLVKALRYLPPGDICRPFWYVSRGISMNSLE